jgi:pyridoxal 5'-phosphate synthase pdxT subunit
MAAPGILALQGGFEAHRRILVQLGYDPILVKTMRDLDRADFLILPGGESTVMTKLLKRADLFEPLAERIRAGLPVFGTCAGMILLSSGVEQSSQPTLGAMDYTVRRNATGRQKESFEVPLQWRDKDFSALFIRAPEIRRIGNRTEVLLRYREKPVLVRQNNCLAASFHPELTGFTEIHRYFLNHI